MLGAGGLDRFLGLGGMGSDVIEEYRLVFRGIIIQDPGDGGLDLVVPGDHVRLLPPANEYCRWHSGPIDRRDNPLDRTYCLREPVGGLGYCRGHSDSLRAVYTRCFSAGGLHSLGACRRLDDVFGRSIMYSLYLLDYGGGVKVGTTRSWRLYERIGEQPHVVATRLLETCSAYTVRDYEIRVGSLHGLSEKPRRRRLGDVVAFPPRNGLRRLLAVIDRVVRALGIPTPDQWIVFRVLPVVEIAYYGRARESGLGDLSGRVFEVIDYWAGYLLLSDRSANDYYVVRARDLLHRDCLGVVR